MRTCPNCQQEYGDDTNYCLQDGTRLRQDEQPTAAFMTLGDLGETVTAEPAPPPTDPAVSEPPVSAAYESTATAAYEPAASEPTFTTAYVPAATEPIVPLASDPAVTRPPLAPAYQPAPARRSWLLALLGGLLLLGGLFVALAIVGYRQFMRVDTAAGPSAANTSAANTNAPLPNTLDPGRIELGGAGATPTPATTANQNLSIQTASPTPRPTAAKQSLDVNSTRPAPADDEPPPVIQQPAKPKTISGGVLNGKAISLPKPAYPPAAKAVGASGSVSVQVLIDEDGRVVSASAVSGHPLLQAAAVAAARGARFSPTSLSGQRVKVSGVITYNFVQ